MRAQNISFLSICSLSLALSLAACSGDDAGIGDELDETGDTEGDGDGDQTTGDGDGDQTTGDGDGDQTTGDGDGDQTTGDGDGDPVEEDTTAPTVVSITPADGEIGVLPDSVITIVFSEPMDKAATQTAYQSADLPPNKVTMKWNAAGDTLTITPNDPLLVAEGQNIIDVEATSYAVTMTNVARDLAGNDLAEPASAEFDVARRIFTFLELNNSLVGTVMQNGTEYPGYLIAGDTSASANIPANAELRFVVSFDMTSLPEGILVFEHGLFGLDQVAVSEDPYGAFGALMIDDVAFDDYTQVYGAAGESLGVMSDGPELGDRIHDVEDSIAADYDAGAAMTQFRMGFGTSTNWDGKSDIAWFDTSPELGLIYLIP